MTALGKDPVTGLILHDKQLSFINDKSKRKVICAGRRSGKTTGVSVLAARGFVAGRRVLYAAPTQEQTDQFWEYERDYFQKDIRTGNIYKNEQRRILDLHGRIKAKTAWDAETMRGDYADLLFLEEFAMMNPSAWDKVGAPMLLDNHGDVVFMSTPKRRNHFHKAYLRAQVDERWKAWHFTSYDNPYLSKDALAEVSEDMTEEAYRQEIMAEFLESEGSVFRNLDAVLIGKDNQTPKQHRGHRLVSGVDWGKSEDYTVCSIGCATCREELVLYRSNKIEYRHQRERLKAYHDRWGMDILAESNAMGDPIIEELQAEGLPVTGFNTSATSKPPLIENLALACEQAEWKLLPDPIGKTELEAYEVSYGQTGRPSYGAPSGLHDDTVMARALMLHAAHHEAMPFSFGD